MKLDKNYKVRVTPEQSRETQELVFGLGGKWNGGTDWVINETIPFLYVTSDLVMTCDSKAQEYFSYASSENTEILATELIAKLEQLTKNDKTIKLDDFLKYKKVRCVKAYGDCLMVGKEYGVIDIRMEVKVKDDEGDNYYWESDHFEPVLEPAENPLQDVELTPEFETEASEFKFEVGNKVYKYGETDVKTVLEVFEDGYMRISNYPHRVNHEVLCHATPENHAVLSRPFPAIEFEQPPTQADIDNAAVDKLAQAMKDKLAEKREQGYHGWETGKHGDLVQLLINHVDKGDPIDVANFCAFLFARGEQLTQGGTR